MKLEYTKDINNQEILQDVDGIHQVMMEWEKPYMEKCIELFEPFGSVLEIGFSFGYSASKICLNKNVTNYSVIECNPVVWKKFEEFKENMNKERPELKINLIKGRWQDVLETCDKYDSCFFNNYIGMTSNENFDRFNKFLFNFFVNNSNINTKVSCYSTVPINLKTSDTINIETHILDIEIPENCKYANGNKIYIPVITKLSDSISELKDIFMKKPLEFEKKYRERIEEVNNFYKQPQNIYCNLMVIDNFYNNPMETRENILKQNFNVLGNYPGKRTISYASEEIKNIIQNHIQHFAGKITMFPMEKTNTNYNGAFQYTTSRDRTWIHNDSWNNWAGVLYLTPNAPITSGTGIYRYKDGTRTEKEAKARGNKEILDKHSQDYTKWECVDNIGNIFNRLILFNANQYHASQDYFGTTKEDGRLFQTFFFSTER